MSNDRHDPHPPTVGSGATATDGGTRPGEIGDDAESRFRAHYDATPHRHAGRSYEHARPAYHFGHLAAERPEYRGREFEAIEADLQKGWTDDQRLKYGDWSTVRGYAREGWSRGRDASAGDARSNDPLPSDASAMTSEPAGGAGSWGEHLEGQPAGRVNPSVGANLGGSPSHQRPSFSDPVAAIADHVAGGVDPDGRVERVANRTGTDDAP